MTYDIALLSITAASIGFIHTVIGPDHYLPFIVMSRAHKWPFSKTMLVTFLCGIGHIGSSVLLGFAGVALGITVTKLEALESFRGNIAAWALIAFGLIYTIWGLRRAFRNKPHEHEHAHSGETNHVHVHAHADEHLHIHAEEKKPSLTPWILFTIFVFGPCEPLIPILMYPAAKHSLSGVFLVSGIFGAVTVSTMLGIVGVTYFGVNFLPLKSLERFSHALAGAAIFLCGIAIQFLGL